MASFDLNRCRLIVKVDGRERLAREYSRQDGRPYLDVIDQDWQAGEHQLAFELQPMTPAAKTGPFAHDPDQVGHRSGPTGPPVLGPAEELYAFLPEGRAGKARRSPPICP